MKLIDITIKNFMPYKGIQKIAFPQDPDRNVMVVFGDNMRGKSSLLNAIRWAFYGTALSRHLKPLRVHELINEEATLSGDWEMEVWIQFEARDIKYDLRRRAIKKHLVPRAERPEDFDLSVAMMRNGAVVPAYQIEPEIAHFAPEQVSRFFLFDGELLQEYETLLIEGSDQGKRIKEAIEQVLGVPALINGRQECATLLKRAQKQQSIDLAQVEGAKKYVESQHTCQTKVDLQEKDIARFKVRLQDTRDERMQLDDDLERIDAVHRAKLSLDEKKRRLDQVRKEHERHEVDRLRLISLAWRDLLQPKLRIKHAQFVAEQARLTEQIANHSKAEQAATNLEQLLAKELCPTCHQPVAEEHRSTIGQELGRLQGELRSRAFEVEGLNHVSAELQGIGKILTNGVAGPLTECNGHLDRLSVDITQLENDIEALQIELEGHDTAEIARKRSLRDQLVKEEGRLEGEMSAAQTSLSKLNQELAILSKELSNVPQARAMRSSGLVNAYTALERLFNQSIEALRDDLRTAVQESATSAFMAMTTQSGYGGLAINANYGLTIIDKFGNPIPIRSSGAEQVVALSLIDGLGKTGRVAGPIVMDTPFGRLDQKHRENILKYLPTTTGQLILLVHDGEIRPSDLGIIAAKIGMEYHIEDAGPRHSRLVPGRA